MIFTTFIIYLQFSQKNKPAQNIQSITDREMKITKKNMYNITCDSRSETKYYPNEKNVVVDELFVGVADIVDVCCKFGDEIVAEFKLKLLLAVRCMVW